MTDPSTSNQPLHDDVAWESCPPGELAGVVRRIRSRRRRAFAKQISAALAVGMLLGAVWLGVEQMLAVRPAVTSPSGIACADVRQHAGAYMQGQLDHETRQRIDQHLPDCPMCQKLYQQMQQENGKQGATFTRDGRITQHAGPSTRPGFFALADRAAW